MENLFSFFRHSAYFAFLTTDDTKKTQRAAEMETNEITGTIIGCAIKVHKELGPGLLESAYEKCLVYELIQSGLHVMQQKLLPFKYGGIEIDAGYRLDLLVEDKVVIEIKSVEALHNIHEAQALTYLKLSNAEIALLINFNVTKLTNGIRRFIAKK